MGVKAEKRKKSATKSNHKRSKIQESSLERLGKISSSNYFVVLENFPQGEEGDALLNLLDIEDIVCKEFIKEDDLFLAFNAKVNEDASTAEKFGVIIGPNADTEREKIAQFYAHWGKDHCKLRRFQDGSTHETISLNNPSGLTYMPLAKIKHLLSVHYPKVQVKYQHLNEDLRYHNLKSFENLKENRRFVDAFCSKIRELCGHGTEMPLRKIEPICACLYKGDTKHHFHRLSKCHAESNSKSVIHGQIREKSNMAPSKLNALNIELDITQKAQMSDNMFARLKMAYAIKLKEMISEQLGLQTQLCGNAEILTIYQDFVFCIKLKKDRLSESKFALQEKLALIGIHSSSFSGLCHLVHQWLSSQFLSRAIDEILIDALIATLFQAEKSKICTVENGFLQFLQMLSFENFAEKFLILGSKEEIEADKLAKFQFDFKTKRRNFPPLTLISNLDLESNLSRNLPEIVCRRLINCARKTLFHLTQDLDLLRADFNQVFVVNEDIFDAVLDLNAYHIPVESTSGRFNPEQDTLPAFPITNYNPLDQFCSAILQTFGASDIQIYANETAHKIGLKFERQENVKQMIEDVTILGKDLIKNVVVNKK